MTKFMPLILILLLSACSEDKVEQSTDTDHYNIDANRISVSGVSSGGHMASQLHLSFSSIFNGVAMVAGGPYYCAMGELSRGLGPCMQGGDLDEESLLAYAESAAGNSEIDALSNLDGDKAWIFHGALDAVVNKDASISAAATYASLISDTAVTLVGDIDVVHGLPTLSTGSPCDTFGTPFLNACDYDAAGEILMALLGELNPRSEATGQLETVVQPGYESADMLEFANVFVPDSCAAGEACGVHVALHGCSQSTEFVGDAFALGAGFNEWASANNLIVLYPQVASSKMLPMNPYGCWDWWGYTGDNYATKAGPQVAAIKQTLDLLAGESL